jgi:hypothetical protein
MSNSSNTGPDILRLNVANDTLQSFANIAGTANLRYRAGSTEYRRVEASDQDSEISHAELKDQERAMRTGNFGSDSSPLARLWFDVVKPVLTHLGLPVCHTYTRESVKADMYICRKKRIRVGDRDSTGAPQADSHPSPSMRLASTQVKVRNAAPTTSSPRTRLRSPLSYARARTFNQC